MGADPLPHKHRGRIPKWFTSVFKFAVKIFVKIINKSPFVFHFKKDPVTRLTKTKSEP